MTSKESCSITEKVKLNTSRESKLKSESFKENLDFNDEYLQEILGNNKSQMELATQIISYDKTIQEV